jgi:hypothetical protein
LLAGASKLCQELLLPGSIVKIEYIDPKENKYKSGKVSNIDNSYSDKEREMSKENISVIKPIININHFLLT